MGRAQGEPVHTPPWAQARATQEMYQAMMQAQSDAIVRQNYMQYLMQPLFRTPDIYIAGQVIDGVTGELKR